LEIPKTDGERGRGGDKETRREGDEEKADYDYDYDYDHEREKTAWKNRRRATLVGSRS